VNTRQEFERYVPTDASDYDVIVAGGGPAGIGAAVAASMQGARTLLLESRGFFGGVAATSLWMPMNRVYLDGGRRGGVHDRFVSAVRAHGDAG
jgi:ribulose 1,5-bisphosphate synthetase/thiazole synthase